MIRALAIFLGLAAPVSAQTTAAEILAALEKPTSELQQLTAILESADEQKALVAMRLMLASGDSALKRIALRAGLTSTNGVARGVALEAYLEGNPNLIAFAEVSGDVSPYFTQWMSEVGSLSAENKGAIPLPVGSKIEGSSCYASPHASGKCGVRVGGTEVSFYVGRVWGTVRLNANGELVGSISRKHNSDFTGPIAITIPLLGQLQ